MAHDTLTTLSQWIWSEYFWIPIGYSWKQLENNTTGFYYPKLSDIVIQSFELAVLLLGLRYLIERCLLFPLGLRLGVKTKKPVNVEENQLLESIFRKSRHVDLKTELELAKKTGLDGRQIQRWFRHRRNKNVQGPMKKFCECGWLSLYYFGMVTFGLIILWDKPWFWKSKLCYEDWPMQALPNELYWYYLIEMSFYWSLLITLMTDVKRKDFWQMGIHHILTLSLMALSWLGNLIRIGCLVLFLHDIADSWIGVAKMAKYCNRQRACEILFWWFILIWIITRVGVYPYWILKNVIFETSQFHFPSILNSKNMFVVLLVGLQVLHWMWTYMILGIAMQKLSHGELKQDTRSESSGNEEESDENENHHNGKLKNANNPMHNINFTFESDSKTILSTTESWRNRNHTS